MSRWGEADRLVEILAAEMPRQVFFAMAAHRAVGSPPAVEPDRPDWWPYLSMGFAALAEEMERLGMAPAEFRAASGRGSAR